MVCKVTLKSLFLPHLYAIILKIGADKPTNDFIRIFQTPMGKRKKPIDFNSKRLFFSIQEVADHFAVNISLLRFWEKEFDTIRPKKTPGGTRQYTREDVQQIEVIYHLVKEKGLTLDGARQTLKEKKDDHLKRVQVLDKLQDIKKELLSMEEEFDRLHEHQKYISPHIEKE
jgi:DNA-binding transcriptional MerR regulator